MNEKKLFENTQKLVKLKKSSAFRLFVLSINLFFLSKARSLVLVFLFIMLFFIIRNIMFTKNQAISIISDITVNLNTIMIPVFAVIITGYAIFQALSNGNTMIRLISINHENKRDKFSTYNLYFYGLSLLYLAIIISNFLLLVIFKYIPSDWYLIFFSQSTNELIAGVLITIYVIINVNLLIEIKSFVFNLFQIFATNASSASLDYIMTKYDSEDGKE